MPFRPCFLKLVMAVSEKINVFSYRVLLFYIDLVKSYCVVLRANVLCVSEEIGRKNFVLKPLFFNFF